MVTIPEAGGAGRGTLLGPGGLVLRPYLVLVGCLVTIPEPGESR